MNRKIFGDFQTPIPLAKQVLKTLKKSGIVWERTLEPTCGVGNFIEALVEEETSLGEVIGIELQQTYAEESSSKFRNYHNVSIINKSIFEIDLVNDFAWNPNTRLLVIGNPPWVTNSLMGVLGGDNLPEKTNFKGLRGIQAITGHSNFDIAEYIWLKLITDLSKTPTTIALLCKTSVARNVLQYAREASLPINNSSIRRIDSKLWFDAAVDACLFTLSLNSGASNYQAKVYRSLEASEPETIIGFVGDSFVSNVNSYNELSEFDLNSTGDDRFIWRAGIKHDASAIMELKRNNRGWINGLDEVVNIEEDYVFPLIKSSDVKSFEGSSTNKGIIVTQRKVGQDTKYLKNSAPKLWNYLNRHKSILDARKSSIYKNKPAFSIFGVGSYSFAPFKVVVSGFYKDPIFTPVGKIDDKPVICDDTCYLLAFETGFEALITAAVLNHFISKRFLESITFSDSKRPFTKDILSRVNIVALTYSLPETELQESVRKYAKYLSTDPNFPDMTLDSSKHAIRLFWDRPTFNVNTQLPMF